MRSQKKQLPMRLSKRHERWIYATASIIFLSGIGWLIAHYFLATPVELEEPHHVSEPWWMRIHGASVMAFLVALGSLFPGHISRAWHAKKNRISGIILLAIMAILIVTGYGLYYIADEEARPWISIVHWGGGLAVACGFLFHILQGRKIRTQQHVEIPSDPMTETPNSVIAFPKRLRNVKRKG